MGGRARPGSAREPRLRGLDSLRALALVLSAGALMAGPVHAGAWPQGKGEGLVIVTALTDRADLSFDRSGDRVDVGHFHKDEVSAYLEYGLTDRITLTGRLAWQTVERRDGAVLDRATGLAASELGLRYPVWRNAHDVAALQFTALVPGAGENVSNQHFGEGDMAYDLRLLWGRNLGPDQFAEIQASHRWRDGLDLDEFHLDIAWGWQVTPRWEVLAQGFTVWNAEPAREARPDFRQHKLQLSAGRRFGSATLHGGIAFTPAGRNAIDERVLFVSLWQRF